MTSAYEAYEGEVEGFAGWEDGSEIEHEDLAAVSVDPTAELDPTGDPVTDSNTEIDAIAQGFRDRMRTEADRLELVTMADYYCCVVFPTGKHLRAFMDHSGWARWGRRGGVRFIDGRKVAEALDIELPPDPDWPQPRRDAGYDSLGMSVEDNRKIDTEGNE